MMAIPSKHKSFYMKPDMKYAIICLGLMMMIYLSCKKEYSCENCLPGSQGSNKTPIAEAGPDQVITLPTDSVWLDGKQSSDPDGTIISYLWKKISGPASFIIVNPSDSVSKVKTLVAGIY